MRKFIVVVALLLAQPAWAADDAVIVTPGSGVPMKSKDVGSGKQAMQPILSDSNGNPLQWLPKMLNALSNTAVSIKSSAGTLGMLICGNVNSSQEYIQVYNIASGSVSVGSSTPVLSIPIPAAANGGFTLSVVGITFSTAISVAATTTATGGSAPSTALDCNAAYD